MTNIDTAVSEIHVYAHRELQLLNQKTEKQHALKAAERLGGDALLDGDANDSIDLAVRLQVELRQIDMAITSCRARRLAAVEHRLACEVQELRERAATARQQAEAITAKTKEHLAALREIEGVDHTPQGTPQSASAANMAGLLERQAAEMERRGIRRDRQLHVDNVRSTDDLLIAVLQDASDGPSATEVLRWHGLIDPDSVFRDRERAYRLNWLDGVIDYASSFAHVDSLRPVLPISGTFTTDAADKNQGRFRAPLSMQPPKMPAPAASPEPLVAAPPEPEAPAPTGSRVVSVDEFFGYSPRRGKTA